ncbi:MAG: hypothetical protein CMJ19_24210 [Phycisphaeraceae bacterium]|nr:hypothetical protein [Phycisphaeraceae bacterium]|tara:strand:+ start:556 stop:897 length:342 start_codon:yes stop_codon:yes gene_type:complete
MLQISATDPKAKPWQTTVFLDDDGEVYMPAGVFGDELQLALCLSYDGQPQLPHEGHVYAPASWLAREYPRLAPKINEAVKHIRQYKPTSDGTPQADDGHALATMATEMVGTIH